MTTWAIVASLATAAGTLVLAIATFSAVRSSNRSAQLAEESLLASVRPLVMASRADDPDQKVGIADDHWVLVPGGRAVVEVTDDVVYLAMSLRNAGTGIAVLHSWRVEQGESSAISAPPPLDDFRQLSRDLYIPPGDIYFWQGAVRDAGDADGRFIAQRVAEGQRFSVEILYGDQLGGQRVMGLFTLTPVDDGKFVVSLSAGSGTSTAQSLGRAEWLLFCRVSQKGDRSGSERSVARPGRASG